MSHPETSEATAEGPRPLGWGRFLLQLGSVALVFVLAAFPPILLLGSTSAGVALSTLASMAAAVLVAGLWLRREGLLAHAFDLSRPPSWARTLGWGLGGTAVIMLLFAVGAPVVTALGLDAPDVSGVMGWVTQSPLTFVMWVVLVAWLSAAFGEELLWRGFLMDRLQRLPGLSGRTVAMLVIHAALFGLPHAYQGWGGVFVTGTIGLFLGWMRLRLKGNLWAPILAHGLVDTIMLSAGYMDSLGWYAAAEAG